MSCGSFANRLLMNADYCTLCVRISSTALYTLVIHGGNKGRYVRQVLSNCYIVKYPPRCPVLVKYNKPIETSNSKKSYYPA